MDYYTANGTPALGAAGASIDIRAELLAIQAAFDLLPSLTGDVADAGKTVKLNAGATGLISEFPTTPRVDQSGIGFVFDRTQISKRVFLTGTLTIPANVFLPGDWVDLYADSTTDKGLTQGAGLTLRLHGTNTTGSRTLLKHGVTRLYFNSTTDAVVDGPDVS